MRHLKAITILHLTTWSSNTSICEMNRICLPRNRDCIVSVKYAGFQKFCYIVSHILLLMSPVLTQFWIGSQTKGFMSGVWGGRGAYNHRKNCFKMGYSSVHCNMFVRYWFLLTFKHCKKSISFHFKLKESLYPGREVL